jgi:hypothetical protein
LSDFASLSIAAQVWNDHSMTATQKLHLRSPHRAIEGVSVNEQNRWCAVTFVREGNLNVSDLK